MPLSAASPIQKTCSRTMKTSHLLIRVVSSETFTRLFNRERSILLQPQCVMRAFQICIYLPALCNDPLFMFKVRRNETICCLIGFGIGVGCCILYRLISNFLTPATSSATSITNNTLSSLSNNIRDAKTSQMGQEHSSLSSNGNEIIVTYTKRPRSSTALKRTSPDTTILPSNQNICNCQHYSNDLDREPLLGLPVDKNHSYNSNKTNTTSHLSDEVTWSEMSSSIGTGALLQDSYHSNSLAGDSGVDCHEISTAKPLIHNQQNLNNLNRDPIIDNDYDENESLINYPMNETNLLPYADSRKYDSDTALSRGALLHDTQTVAESHVMSYMSTEKGLERALEQTSRFYSDLEHIATDLNTLSKRYSQSQTIVSPSMSKYYNKPALNTIDALDWDWNDVYSSPLVQSPKNHHRKNRQHFSSSSLSRLTSNNKHKVRRRLNNVHKQTDYNESDLEIRTSLSYDCTSSPLKHRPSSVYFDSTDNTSGDENFGDETLQIPSISSVLNSSKPAEYSSNSK